MRYLIKFYYTAILILGFAGSQLIAQSSYELLFTGEKNSSAYGDVLCTKNGTSFVSVSQMDVGAQFPNTVEHYIYKISTEGDTSRWGFDKQDSLIFVREILYDTLDRIIVHGDGVSVQEGEVQDRFYWISSMDTNFMVYWFKTFHFAPDDYNPFFDYSRVLKLTNNEFLHVGISTKLNLKRRHSFRFNSNGDSLQLIQNYSEYNPGEVHALTYSPDSSSIYVHLGRVVNNYLYSTANGDQLDLESFDSISSFYYPDQMTTPFYDFNPPYSAINFPNNTIIAAGEYMYGDENNNSINCVGAFKFDENFNVMEENRLAFALSSEIDVKPTDFNCIDYVHPNEIYVSGIYDEPPGFGVSELDCWVYVAKLDQNLNLIWEKYLGGDAWYHSSCMEATYDGGVILTGQRYDENINIGTETDVYVWKLDSDGMVNIGAESSLQLKEAIVFPNPSKEKFYLRTALLDTEFILYNMLGIEVLRKSINEKTTYFNINTLSKGEYIWNLVGEKGIVENGKWIKQ